MNTLDFLKLLFGQDKSGYVTLSYPIEYKWYSKHFEVQDLENAAKTALTWSEEKKNVFFGCGVRKEKLDPYHRGTSEQVKSIPGIWVDIDVIGPTHVNNNLPKNVEEAAQLLDLVPFDPTIIIWSGYGLHAYWVFKDRPIENNKEAAQLIKTIQKKIKNNPKGYVVDSTADMSRVLRLPGTKNYKIATDPQDVVVIDSTQPVYTFKDFFSPSTGRSTLMPTPTSRSASVEGDLSKNVGGDPSKSVEAKSSKNVEGGLVKYTPEQFYETFKDSDRQEIRDICNKRSFAEIGNRDNAMQSLSWSLAKRSPGSTPEELLEVIKPSLEVMEQEAIAAGTDIFTEEMVLSKLRRGLESIHAEIEEEEKLALEKIKAVRPKGPYTAEEIAEFARENNCSVEEFHHRWIIQYENSFFIFENGKYLSPIGPRALETGLSQILAPSPIKFVMTTKNGDMKPRSHQEILKEHARIALKNIANLAIQKSYYVAESRTFYEAVCPLRNIVPTFHVEISEWLTLLGGQHLNKLLDWIATITFLDRQTCAIYLSGPPDAGKTMLAHGLAKLWGENPTQFESAIKEFNSALTTCPLVCADEQIPLVQGKKISSTVLRKLIGSSFSLNRKHIAETSLVGHPRFIFCANNKDMLALDDELSKYDSEAVAGRFLHIEVSEEAVKYIRNLGGRAATDRWVAGNMIAEHALWLRDNRKVELGSRFLVQGDAGQMARDIIIRNKANSLLLEWICKFIINPNQDAKTFVCCGNGEVLVCASAFSIGTSWETFIHSEPRPPGVRVIGKALKNISTKEVRKNGKRMHAIDIGYLYEWCEAYGSMDKSDLEKEINKPVLASVTSIKEG